MTTEREDYIRSKLTDPPNEWEKLICMMAATLASAVDAEGDSTYTDSGAVGKAIELALTLRTRLNSI